MTQLAKTPVARLECYYLGRKDGVLELNDMHLIDFEAAHAAHPDHWAPVETYKEYPAYKMPTGPEAPKVIDIRNHPIFPTIEEMSSVPPPMAVGNPYRSVGETVRSPVIRKQR